MSVDAWARKAIAFIASTRARTSASRPTWRRLLQRAIRAAPFEEAQAAHREPELIEVKLISVRGREGTAQRERAAALPARCLARRHPRPS